MWGYNWTRCKAPSSPPDTLTPEAPSEWKDTRIYVSISLANRQQERQPGAKCCLNGSKIIPLRCFLSMKSGWKLTFLPMKTQEVTQEDNWLITHHHLSSTESHSFPSGWSGPHSRAPGPCLGRHRECSLLLLVSCGYKTTQVSGALEKFRGLGRRQGARKQAYSQPKC